MQLMQRSASEIMNHATMRTVSGMLRNFSATLPDTLLAGLPGSLLPPVTPRPVSVPQTARAWQPGDQASFFKSGVAKYACRPQWINLCILSLICVSQRQICS